MQRLGPADGVTLSGRASVAQGRCRFGHAWQGKRRRLAVDVRLDPRTAADLAKLALIRRYPRTLFWLAACGLIFLVWQRCPSVIAHATFWAEDGWVWYPQCYATGWHCLLLDHSAYLQTSSMLVALASLLFPLVLAPKVFAFASLLMQAAPAIFLLSSRMAPAIPSLAARAVLALLLVAIPGMSEVYVNLTNSQWHLALLAFLVLTAAPARGWPARLFDGAALLLSGLSGPFAPLLVPVALLWWWLHREAWTLWRLAVIAVAAAIQLSLVVLHQSTRGGHTDGIGWSLGRLINIVDTDILGVAAFGRQAMIAHHWVVSEGWLSGGTPAALILGTAILAGACLLAAVAALRGPWVLRAFLIFAGLEFASSLVDGMALTQPLWVALGQWIGMRYYFHPIAAWLAILVTLACDRHAALRVVGVAILALTVLVAIPADWELPKHPKPTVFRAEARAFAKAPPGTVMSFPIPPIDSMVLVKH